MSPVSKGNNSISDVLKVNMFGSFTITEEGGEGATITANLSGRAHRLWLLIAYLIVNRHRGVSPQELIDLLWPEVTSSNPASTLQNNVSRARALFTDAGFTDARDLLKYVDGLYYWAPEKQTVLDAAVFEERTKQIGDVLPEDDPAALDFAVETCSMYKGDFLGAAADVSWCSNLAVYYRVLYKRVCKTTIDALLEVGRLKEAERLCVQVTEIDPAAEEFSVLLMRAYIMDGDPATALEHYQAIANYLEETFDVQPSTDLQAQREVAIQKIYGHGMNEESIRSFLREDDEEGAFLCSNSIFREVVQLRQREMARTGADSFIIAINVHQNGVRDDRQIINIKRITQSLANALRSSDPFTKVGADQFLILLPGANEENAKLVYNRIIAKFNEEFPQAELTFDFSLVSLADL